MSEFTPIVMALLTKSDPFPSYLFGDQFHHTSPMTWWKSVNMRGSGWPKKGKQKILELCKQLSTAVAATAELERIFSTFGIVQSKLRNRLRNEKAAKLVFMFKYFNQETGREADDFSWIWAQSQQNSEEENG